VVRRYKMKYNGYTIGAEAITAKANELVKEFAK
jgi:hypothetical protein